MKTVLFIITGSIAAFKALEIMRMLVKGGIRVIPVLSKGGEAFVTSLSVSSLCGEQMITEDSYKMEHIFLSRNIDLIIICPAGASFLNKYASGYGGELALDILLAKQKNTPVLIAPAMNVEMWNNSNTQNSIKKLEYEGCIIINPESGQLLCNEEGEGKLASIDDIYSSAIHILTEKERLKGKKVLITSGATIEKIDEARYVSNFSSGLQGALIVKELQMCGAEVFLVEGKVNHGLHPALHLLHHIKVISAKEMYKEVMEILKNERIDYFFSVAAVCDFYVKNSCPGKAKKENIKTLTLEENPDILKSVGLLKSWRPLKVFGFAAETEDLLEDSGRKKLINKNCDVLFANPMCFETYHTSGIIFYKDNKNEKFHGSKKDLAKKLISLL